ncbi:MAG TPA: hypothetical protein VF263_14240 [Longimicrobiaceae bacterium]
MATWPDVANSAVQIGLGALLGGTFGYFNARLGHRSDAAKEYSKSRRQLLQKAVQQCNAFSQLQADYWATLYDLLDKKSRDERPSDEEQELLSRRGMLLRDGFKGFADIESHLLLAGEEELYTEFRRYADASDEFFVKAHLDDPGLSADLMNAFRKQFREMRKLLLLKVGIAYKRAPS